MTARISSIVNGVTVYIREHSVFPLLGLGIFLSTTPLHAQHISGEVYGGGHLGTVSGCTHVSISEGEIGQDRWVTTPNGGIFGGGEGESAIVSKNSYVRVTGGTLRNSVYGGGKKANLEGNTNVNILGGVIRVNVYAGARMADVSGYTYVYVHDSTNVTTTSPVLGAVYGGNDIAGIIHNTNREAPKFYSEISSAVKKPDVVPTSFVRVGEMNAETQPYIGTLYGGSDGGYTYVYNNGRYDVTLPNDKTDPAQGTTVESVSVPPTIDRTFIEFNGGTVGNMFAGGDNVTVTDAADIHLNSHDANGVSATISRNHIAALNATDGYLNEFGTGEYTRNADSTTVTFKYEINRCFGGNNRAAMDIRPNWHLETADVNNLYSGGNKGEMTYANGILVAVEGSGMSVQNVFGGGRLADIHPSAGSITAETLEGFDFPAGYAARVLIKGGKVHNVYGGNDVSGQVYHGAAVVIRSDIIENVYGSGNGAYSYFSNSKHDDSDYYFQANGLTGLAALQALNRHRPNTENVLIDIAGSASDMTYVGGSVFCGGNCATLRDLSGSLEYARAKLKLGSYVTANNVFLGSNGAQMLSEDAIIKINDDYYNPNTELTDHDQMVEYMKGVEVAIKPSVEFADDYVSYSTSIGSFYCGGNKGSMSASGTFTIDFLKSIKIFDKLVAGSNDANVVYKADSKKEDGTTSALVNHSYVLGGLTSQADPKVLLNVTELKMEPKRLEYDEENNTYTAVWNRYSADDTDMKDYEGFLHGANIYGGCYTSGYVNGGVEINISSDITTTDFFTEIAKKKDSAGNWVDAGEGDNPYDWDHHVFEPFISMLTCYGGGYGSETEIWGNTSVNLIGESRIMKIRGGGQLGWVGKMKRDATTGNLVKSTTDFYRSYYYNDSTKYYDVYKNEVEQAYDATVHVNADYVTNPNDPSKMANNVAEICAGGFAGVVTGNTHAIVDKGCMYTVFGGASNAHIYGGAETLIGENGFPYITQTVYGGNDFGGIVMGTLIHETNNLNANSIQKVKSNTYVEYFSGEIGYNTGEHVETDSVSADFGIFGGGYGWYDYRTSYEDGNKYYGKAVSQPNLLGEITIDGDEADHVANCFVNISSKTTDVKDKVMRIYGGGQGYPGKMGVADARRTYVLFNAANANARPNLLAQYVFGAGDCSRTWYSRLDAYSGNVRHAFGANRGVSYEQGVDNLVKDNPMVKAHGKVKATSGTAGETQDRTYMGEYTELNLYSSMIAPTLDVYGSGAYSGSKRSVINLYGGQVNDVYGASINEGVTYMSRVNVPKGSKVKCNAIYGGGQGMNTELPCDIYITYIDYNSADAIVEEGIYGGNRDYRFTRRTQINIDVPVKNSLGKLVNVYGGGKGANTISEITFINLQKGSEVKNVFGGGCDGKVYSKPAVINYMLTTDYFRNKYTFGSSDGNGGTRDATNSYCLGDCEVGGFNTWKLQEGIDTIALYKYSKTDAMTIGTLAPLKMDYNVEYYAQNTDVYIHDGAIVEENAYGAGYGEHAYTAGVSTIHLLGGTVLGNVYGGGYGGHVMDYDKIEGTTLKDGNGDSRGDMIQPIQMNIASKVYLEGGTCGNSYGGGENGDVLGNTYTYIGDEGTCGNPSSVTYLSGSPAIRQSVYGGGEQGEVNYATNYGVTPNDTLTGSANAYVYMYNGYVGYTYDADAEVENDSDRYVMNIDYKLLNDSVFYHNGNVFGGGYGEGANVIKTHVTMTGGIIRNSLYGGGEIAAIGQGTVTTEAGTSTPSSVTVTRGGQTHIYMYGGHVLRDVFGGGRGYAYNLSGDEVVGTTLHSDGFVFGSTDVNIYRGEVGTADQESLDLGYGNVFGGGNVGYVYSAIGTKATKTEGNRTAGYYYLDSTTSEMSKDCSVLISPYTKVTASDGVTIDGTHYGQCAYVPTSKLNLLKGKESSDKDTWEKMDYITGVTIHNAVFAGGNVTRGDSKLYADTKTVLGNATAVINDIYHRDLTTIGTEHIGGIYGDGNLTMVDGFREICIINYGTDYYALKTEISLDEYNALNDRERSYFQLKYKCINAYDDYVIGQQILDEVYEKMTPSEQLNWTQTGFCSVYAGRLLNTIQRADLVGVHGSRIVLQGAQDRTVSVVDYLEYAINRVGEVSLNQRASQIANEDTDSEVHGNYFGFYNTVKYLEALTSDVDFYSVRTTTNDQRKADGGTTYGTTTYYQYKEANKGKTWRNNASSNNKIALNSGVYLEITKQSSTDTEKVYGPITGVVELDLMDLGENLGGAFVYAENIHGERISGTMDTHAHISEYNANCVTYRGVQYKTTTDHTSLETSGNFVHPTKPIVDDCYPGSANVDSKGHYWYLRGSIYLYDQYISAYTGSSTAYKADVQIPLTITAGTHGRLKILNIQPNLYAYYDKEKNKMAAGGKGTVINGTTYHLNDVITYWDWSQLTSAERELFVRDTYIAMQEFSYEKDGSSVTVAKGDVMLSSEYDALPDNVEVLEGTVSKAQAVHISNATSHDNGYALTADISNPGEWDDRYVHITDASNIITKEQYLALTDEEKKNYFVGPSYHATAGVYGQTDYAVGDIISDEIHGAYDKIKTKPATEQATVEATYITTGEITYTYNGTEKTLTTGVGISQTEYDEAIKVSGNKDKLQRAYVCNSTIKDGSNYYIVGELVSKTVYDNLGTDDKTKFSMAWICTKAGKYGGAEYTGTQNYDALKGWCDLTAADRDKFNFNYDALDLFITNLDPEASVADYDKPGTTYYSDEIELDYQAISNNNISYTKDGSTVSYTSGEIISREKYEAVPNEMIYYSYMSSKSGVVYVVEKSFIQGDVPYTEGDVLSTDDYAKVNTDNRSYIKTIDFDGQPEGTYFYCKKAYTAGAMGTVAGMSSDITDVFTSKTYTTGQEVPVGTIITNVNYSALPNLQNTFTITGTSPIETSTLYVARDANMQDVMKDRVITLIYQYQYDETAEDNKMETITERHIVNIHLLFKSGSPSIGRLRVPGAVLPGTTVGLKQPAVTKGAYEILGGGWEIYDNQADADNHINGQPYHNNSTVLYFYQTGQYVSYYAKTYLGKTYSNAVQLEVANYHSINDVMADTEHHMYIDNDKVPRNPKVYIDNDLSQSDPDKSELDLLRDLYDLSVADGSPLNNQIKGCQNLDFVLQTDVSPKKYTDWTPLGTETNCFGNNGFFHGDGHVVKGINNSLFGNYCGAIYNLGVKGNFNASGFTGAAIAKDGNYAANCWVWNENPATHTGNAFFGNTTPNLYNCYYYEADDATVNYTPITNTAIRKNETAFNNGEVAFDLNKYYLVKRYTDNLATKPTDVTYSYWTDDDGTLTLHEDGKYNAADAPITVTYYDDNNAKQTTQLGYVEYRYWDGDFVNADAEIHTDADDRYYSGFYYPIYPDDYIFFGQTLNYGYVDGIDHNTYPNAVLRTEDNRLQLVNSKSNRVFRAPAYYGTMDKQVTHFNVNCVLPYQYQKEVSHTIDTKTKTAAELGITIIMTGSNIDRATETLADGSVKTTITTTADDAVQQIRTITTEVTISQPTDVYPNMTSVDFTGYNDYPYAENVSNGVFYTPILDYKTLVDFSDPDQTRNLLVYANSTSDPQGYEVLDNYLFEPVLRFASTDYNNIPKISDAVSSAVQGHLIDKQDGAYVTDRHHFLVDENNFHCPIAYNMGATKRMWYQRNPATYNSTGNNGFESVVLPFTADLVSAHEKGEVTHFYNNDKSNHEYWLRGFRGVSGEGTTESPYVLKFLRPMASGEGADSRYETKSSSYIVTNDFLYEYYYSSSYGKDDNSDVYQQTYYKDARVYENYIQMTANVPYLVAFPGKKFYEFDMSGEFTPSNSFAAIKALDKQTISFCSACGAEIVPLTNGEDDLVSSGDASTFKGFSYQGIYQKRDMTVASESNARIITSNGDTFAPRDKVYLDKPEGEQALTVMQPFHAYLKVPAGGGVKEITIGNDASYIEDFNENSGTLEIVSRDRAIFVTSHMTDTVYLQIVNAAGQLITTLSVAPGHTESHEVPSAGVYMVGSNKILVR